MDFGRLITAMVTPFDADGQIDWLTAGNLIDYLIDVQKADSLVVSGTTGESPTLSEDEKLALFRFVVKHSAGRCKVIAGTGCNNTAHTIHLTKEAETCGVDGILLVAPYYNRPTQEGLYQHFKAVAEETKLPIILYNVEGRTAVNLSVETTLKLAKIDNIVATKDCATLEQLTLIISSAPEGFNVYSGDDAATLPALAIGAYGIVSVAGHIIGSEMKELIHTYLSGNVVEASRINSKLFPYFKGLFNCPHPVPNPVAVKYALGLKGLPVGGVRLPLVSVTETEAQFLRELIS
ncbi:4-hydroxy-tetrahydrodipicolinate synthase [Paenibacillus sp. GSMTC-2017]|uniref:4-hydroxy-tetrahydrodipicolinate synthase n=1 Tax=Paenibacillus sp. GSMTC-2017 TaxID=2794350 RepID=UPI0018D5CF78|nr:4-hydroxy-tetrahydrodipicolinate synthase [Paenibacillus sp. GSMTC-2017]MBH5316583.1 4-hydroxy-tetrahydrodipicolinate synthase [Paenibacillus sp. GSMTC-2017]